MSASITPAETAQAALDWGRRNGWGPQGRFGGTVAEPEGCLTTAVHYGYLGLACPGMPLPPLAGDGSSWPDRASMDEYRQARRAVRDAICSTVADMYPDICSAHLGLISFYDSPGVTPEMVEAVLEKVAAR